jgi:AraC-like DNA-binding protein
MAEIVEVAPTPNNEAGFSAEFQCWKLGDIIFTRTLVSGAPERQWRHRPKSFPDHWCVVLSRNTAIKQALITLSSSSANNLSFRPLALPFDGRARNNEVLALFLPRDQAQGSTRDIARTHDWDLNPSFMELLANYMSGLALQLPHMSSEHAQRLVPVTRSLFAACIAPVPKAEAMEASVASLLIERAWHVVRQNMASPEFGPKQLCRLLGVSRSKLYRLFESSGGVARLINRERLREAHRRLSESLDMPSIHAVGNEVGFEDHSTFSRAFRREFGSSPSEVREKALAKLFTMPVSHP